MTAIPASCYSWQDGPYEGDSDPEAVWCEAHEAFYTALHPCGACEWEAPCEDHTTANCAVCWKAS